MTNASSIKPSNPVASDLIPEVAANETGAWASVADGVLQRLKEAILSGELPPGSKISEPEMAKRFGISRAPLREAIRRLEERKLVTHIPRQGARVIVLTPERVRQIFVIREAIEGMAAREAALRISAEEIAHLRESLLRQYEQMTAAQGSTLPHVNFDTDYHSAIVRASGNEFLVQFLSEDYHPLIELCRSRQQLPQVPTMVESGVADFDIYNWFAFFAPPDVSRGIIDKLNAAVNAALATAEVQNVWARQGIVNQSMKPSELGSFVEAESKKYKSLISSANITVD